MVIGAFDAVGLRRPAGRAAAAAFAEAGIGAPDGTDVAGRLEPFARRRAACCGDVFAACCPAPWRTA